MKQIITLLFVILVSIPINAQSKQIKQEFENVKRASISRANQFQNDKFRNTQNRNFIVKRKTEYLKSLEKKFLDSLIYQEKVEESNIWRYTNKKIFTYNNDKIDIITVYNWNDITSNWEPFQRDEYTFDVNGNLVKEIRSFQYAPGVWLYGNKTEYSYFINNNNLYDLELEVNSIWDIHTTQWVNANKYELSYDSNMSSLTVELAFEWSTSLFAWVYKSKNEYIPHLLFADFKINSNWNSIENLWDYNTKWEYIRSGMPVTEEIVYNWVSEPTNDWIEDSKIDYEYDYGGPDAFPRQTCETGYSWNNTMNQWETNYKDEYDYPSSQLSISTYFEWNESANEWEPHYKDEFIFDTSHTITEFINPYNYNYSQEFDDLPWYSYYYMMIGYRSYNFVYPLWEDRSRMFFYYSNYTNPLQVDDKIIADAFKVYPNPVNDILRIDSEIQLTKVEFYSLIGKKIMEVNNVFDAIPLSNLSDGIYLVKISADNKILVKRIIKSN